MVTDELREYIKKVKESGKSLNEIRDVLRKREWKADDVQQAFVELGYEKAAPESPKDDSQSTSSQTPSPASSTPPRSGDGFFAKIASLDHNRYYPDIKATLPEHPQRFWAIPILGGLIKYIILIPVFLWSGLLGIFVVLLLIINSVVVLLKGRYTQVAYKYSLGYMRLNTKTIFFFAGLTDKYPGFGLDIQDAFSLDMPYPKSPNRFFAVPFLGGIVRMLILIPFIIVYLVVYYGAILGVAFIASFSVLFRGKYPESIFELTIDSVRLMQRLSVYSFGLSDSYPSFHISMNHTVIKIILLILGGLWLLFTYTSDFNRSMHQQPYPRMNNYTYPTINPYPSTSSPSTFPTNYPSPSYAYPTAPGGTVTLPTSKGISPTSPFVYPSVRPSPSPLPGY